MAEQFRLYLLGGFRLERDGQEIVLPRAKVKTLLAYLALHPQEHPREHLASLFWGDVTTEQARLSLRVALADLRKIHPNLILADRETAQLNPDFPLWADARALGDWRLEIGDSSVHSKHASNLQSLVSLYSGELLAGFYDEWIEPERETFRAYYLELLLRVVEQYRSASDYANAISFARKMLETDRAHETAHQHLIFLYAAQGDRAGALKQFEECVAALDEELGVEPSPETIALAKQINKKPTTKSAAAAQTNLPKPLTSFVGRARELEEICAWLGRGEAFAFADVNRVAAVSANASPLRVLTLTGPGGSGKTRLGIQAGRALLDTFPDGVWWVELASLADASLVPEQIAKSVGAQPQPNEAIEDTLATFFRARDLLLILDNCEHLIEACAQIAQSLVSSSPISILSTSREALNIPGEQTYPVAPLDLPRAVIASFAAQALEFSAVRLFVERARLADARFELNEQNVLPLTQICMRLDGIPLAIELAAARVKQMNVSEIAARLDSRFDLLIGARTAVPRQQTLRALIDWSYNLLDAAEQNLFRQLAVFAGGWTLEAVEQVTGDGGQRSGLARANPYSPTLDTLLHLVDKSLVVVEMDAAETRYRLLETIREYAREKLYETGSAAEIQQKHLAYFLQMAEETAPRLWGRETLPTLKRLEREHDNLRAALRFAFDSGDMERTVQLAGALGSFWHLGNHGEQAERWYARILALPLDDVPPPMRARLFSSAGTIAWTKAEFARATELHQRALALYQALDDTRGIARSLNHIGAQYGRMDDSDLTLQYLRQADALARSVDDSQTLVFVLNNLGVYALNAADPSESEAYYDEGLQIAEREGDLITMSVLAVNLAECARLRRDFARAYTLLERAVDAAQAIGNTHYVNTVQRELGSILALLGRLDEAEAILRDTVTSARKNSDTWGLGAAISRVAHLASVRGQSERSARLWGYTFASLERIPNATLTSGQMQEINRLIDGLREKMGAAKFESEFEIGKRLSETQALELVFEAREET